MDKLRRFTGISDREIDGRDVRDPIGFEQIRRCGSGIGADARTLTRADRHRIVETTRGSRPVVSLAVSVAQRSQEERAIKCSIGILAIDTGTEPSRNHVIETTTMCSGIGRIFILITDQDARRDTHGIGGGRSRLPAIPVTHDQQTDILIDITGIGDMEVGLLVLRNLILDFHIDIERLQLVGTELAGLPLEVARITGCLIFLIQQGAQFDGVRDLRAVRGIRSLDVELDVQYEIVRNFLRDEPEGQFAVRVVEVVSISGITPGGAGQLLVPLGDGTIGILAGISKILVVIRIVKLQIERSLGRARRTDIGPGHDTICSNSTLTIRIQTDEFDLGDDGLRLSAVLVSVGELDTGERVLHCNRSTARKLRIMVLLVHGNLTEKEILLIQAVLRGRQFEGSLIISHTATGCRHTQIEIDLFRLVLRPRAAIVVMVVTPAIAVLVIHLEGRITKFSSGIHAHARIDIRQSHRINGLTLGGRTRIEVLDSLFQVDGLALRDLHRNRDTLDSRGRIRRTGGNALHDKSKLVFTDLDVVEVFLPDAGRKQHGREDRHCNVNLLHNSILQR